MDYLALATDFDGTLATDGRVEPTTLDALKRWRASGRKLILITGRQMSILLEPFPDLPVFDWVVAENGALLYNPATGVEKPLVEPPPEEFFQRLRDRVTTEASTRSPQDPLWEEFTQLSQDPTVRLVSRGRVIVATWKPHDQIAAELIQELGLDLEIILNKAAVMILPRGVDKAFGLRAALQELGMGPEQTIGLGDAENDTAFLDLCGLSVAVANALPELKLRVKRVTQGSRGAGVVETIDQILGA
ncbi:haloacid dehalogenase [Leptolyngbya sp. 'hensonii']|uniref:HAD family hydrolase n=1 Tax=Leptolyngbya sp. 'hensonii' TaxID=1922337 RepID=UPI00094F5104|nr:HAD family hydrolase [Leptolyngbya sp. 'hensonii']OLP15733.1 haloacid dehalogenase [Leptolyngbya sp. 'hensonii']